MLQEKKPGIKSIFAGSNLSCNAHFNKDQFSFCDISSATPYRGKFLKVVKSMGPLLRGIRESLALFEDEKPDLVIGFGSFHTFPILCAATLKKIPLILFESNSIPGKVIKLFSKKALFTAIFFEEAKRHLKGNTVQVEIPGKDSISEAMSPKEARLKIGLEADLQTLLVFGGSQGARQINQYLIDLLPILKKNFAFQLIHLTGNEETSAKVDLLCQSLGIPCYVKKFETQMDMLWKAADLAICRSGAMTLSEILTFEVPAILIPFPFAADQHQLKNAQIFQKKIGGGIYFHENSISTTSLAEAIHRLSNLNSQERLKMKEAIQAYKVRQKKEDLCSLIIEYLCQK